MKAAFLLLLNIIFGIYFISRLSDLPDLLNSTGSNSEMLEAGSKGGMILAIVFLFLIQIYLIKKYKKVRKEVLEKK